MGQPGHRLQDDWAHRFPLAVAGAGIGLLIGPSGADAVSRAGRSSYGEVTGVNQTVRNYGAALSFAILGTILTHVFTARFTDSLVGLGLPRAKAAEIAAASPARRARHGRPGVDAGGRRAGSRARLRGRDAGRAAGDGRRPGDRFVVALRHPGDRPAQGPGRSQSTSRWPSRRDDHGLRRLDRRPAAGHEPTVRRGGVRRPDGVVLEAGGQAAGDPVGRLLVPDPGAFALLGTLILHAFGISLYALQIAGGLVVAYAGFGMLSQREGFTAAERADALDRAGKQTDIAISPMALPIVAGPGAIGVVIALAARQPRPRGAPRHRRSDRRDLRRPRPPAGWATPLVGRLGPVVVGALVRVMGFLILAIGVELVTHGVLDLPR